MLLKMNLTAVAAALLLGACSSPPKAPTVDDSKKRPVNVSQAVDLQMCRSELRAAEIVLTESLAEPKRRLVSAPVPAQASAAQPNRVFIIGFPTGSADFAITEDQGARLVAEAKAAKLIVIRGRTDATVDSTAETRLAQRRAEAAFKYLAPRLRLPAEGIRLSWQGAGDTGQNNGRRVEIEFYQASPVTETFSGAATVAARS